MISNIQHFENSCSILTRSGYWINVELGDFPGRPRGRSPGWWEWCDWSTCGPWFQAGDVQGLVGGQEEGGREAGGGRHLNTLIKSLQVL